MADTLWTGKNSDKLYEQSGSFTSTVKVSLSVASITTEPTDISPHGTDEIMMSEHIDEKVYLLSGKFSTTVHQSIDHSAYLYSAQGCSPDEVNTLVCGDGADLGSPDDEEIYLFSGKMTSTIKSSIYVTEKGTPLGISSDGVDTTWVENNHFYYYSGQITSTVKDSYTYGTTDREGIDWDGTDILSTGYTNDKLTKYSGRFTSTIKDSISISGHDTSPEGIASSNFDLRLGIGNFASITLPLFSITTMNVISLPMFTVAAFDYNALFRNDLPMFTLDTWAQQGNEVRITLPSLSVDSYANPGNNTVSLTLPFIGLDAPASFHCNASLILPRFSLTNVTYQGEVYGVDISMPMLTVSIEVGKRFDLSIPSLTVSATGSNGIVGTFNRNLPRMIVSAEATQHFLATGNIVLPLLSINANLLTGIVSVSGSTRNIPMMKLTAHAFQGVHGSVSLSLPFLTLTTETYANPNGDGVIGLQMFTLSAFADVHINRVI